jgi:hypothetical protein
MIDKIAPTTNCLAGLNIAPTIANQVTGVCINPIFLRSI